MQKNGEWILKRILSDGATPLDLFRLLNAPANSVYQWLCRRRYIAFVTNTKQ
jgi:hypothetical protein